MARLDDSRAPSARWARALRAAGLALAAAACAEPPPVAPNVILITLDTVRADHLGCYGYARDTTPELDRIAAGATRFTHAWSTSPWTLPSHASLFTGLYPFEHGAHTLEPMRAPDGRLAERVVPLAERHRTLAEFLGEEGYATAGFVANTVYLNPTYQIGQGFETWDVERVRARPLNAKALAWIDARAASDAPPFLLFLNYMDAHRPYNVEPRPDDRLPPAPDEPSGELLDALYEAVMASRQPAPPELVEKLVRSYDVALANLSEALGELRAALETRGLWDDTLIVITSDHGEYFGEHFLVEHSKDVYEEAVRVPLIVKAPRQREGRVDARPVAGADVAGLVVEHLVPAARERGREAFENGIGRRAGGRPVLAENWFTRVKDLAAPWGGRFRRVRTAVWFDDYKYIHSSDGENELYDLSADPRELENLVVERAVVAEGAARALTTYQAARAAAPGEPVEFGIDADLLEEMRRLGYLGAAEDE